MTILPTVCKTIYSDYGPVGSTRLIWIRILTTIFNNKYGVYPCHVEQFGTQGVGKQSHVDGHSATLGF
jgi:hypothetical protein